MGFMGRMGRLGLMGRISPIGPIGLILTSHPGTPPAMHTDITIKDIRFSYEDFRYRTPIKFGGVALDRVTVLDVEVDVETLGGKRATGFGSMPLGNVWAYPSRAMGYQQTLDAMKAVTERVAAVYSGHHEAGHPID